MGVSLDPLPLAEEQELAEFSMLQEVHLHQQQDQFRNELPLGQGRLQ